MDELISGDKIKYFSHILFWAIVSYIYWVCYQYKISLLQFDNNKLDLVSIFSLVLTIWASYGVYVGFLQFMAGYDNKENGTYLGYQKMDFLTKSNIWYHLTNSWEFFGSLLLSIIIPLIVKFNISAGVQYQYIWQSIIGFLLILFVFLLKFSLKVAKITIFINKKTDVGLKEVIELDIKNRYNKYFNTLIKQKFSYGVRESYFRQVKMDLSNIDNDTDKIIFLKVICFSASSYKFIKSIEGFEKCDIFNYKRFIKEKYDLIAHFEFKSEEVISLAISLFQQDAMIFDKLIKKNIFWIESDYDFYHLSCVRDKTILGIECNEKERILVNNWFEYSEIHNIHIYMFKILGNMATNKQDISRLVNLIQDRVSQTVMGRTYWETDRTDQILIFEKSSSDSSFRIFKNFFSKIKKFDVFYSSSYPGIKYKSNIDDVWFSLSPDILKIDFYFKDGGQCYIKRNEIRDYYDEYEEKVWNVLFDKYRNSNDLSDVFLPDLKEPENVVDFLGDSDEIIIRDYDNKLSYSRICFKYLTDNYDYVDNSISNFTNLLNVVKTMSANYRGAFALYQLLYPDNRNWDSSVESYIEILSDVLPPRNEEREKTYNDIVSIINTIKYGANISGDVLVKVFETKDVKLIDDAFLKKFKKLPTLKLVAVQSILSTDRYNFRKVELADEWEKRDLAKQYIKALSIAPSIFPDYTNDYKILNSTMSKFLLDNMQLLTARDFEELPLSSILLFEKFLYWKWFEDDKNDETEFMISLIKEEFKGTASGYRYCLRGSLLKFFTLKLIEGQGYQYLRVVTDKDFKKEFKFALLYHFKKNQLTLDMYLDTIEDELKNYDSIMMGGYDKVLINREVEKIVFENYLYLE